MADADGKMRIEKCRWKKMPITKKVRGTKTRNGDGKKKKQIKKQTNKQTNKQRKEIFLSSSCHMVGPLTYIQNMMPIVGTVL